jgi:hypothetical protein
MFVWLASSFLCTPHRSVPVTLTELLAHWRSTANTIRPYNAGAAHAYEQAARELEESMRAMEGETLTLARASRESGYSADHLRHLVASSQLPNAGRKGAPRIARKDLPKRASKRAGASYDAVADALALVSLTRSA